MTRITAAGMAQGVGEPAHSARHGRRGRARFVEAHARASTRPSTPVLTIFVPDILPQLRELGRRQTISAAQVIHAEAVALRARIEARVSNIQAGVVALSDAECDALDQLHGQWKQKLTAVWSMVGDQTTSPGTGA